MEHGRRTSWTGGPRPRCASARGGIRTSRVNTLIVSPLSTSACCTHTTPIISSQMPVENAELNRQIGVFRNAVTHRKQRVATRSNRQKIQIWKSDDLGTTSVKVGAFCAPFRPFLTGSGSQSEFVVTHSKQSTGEFLTGARTAISRDVISTRATQKLAGVKQRNRYDIYGCIAFLPGSAQTVESDVTYSKQTTGDFLPGATTPQFGSRTLSRGASSAQSKSSNIDTKLSEERAWLRL